MLGEAPTLGLAMRFALTMDNGTRDLGNWQKVAGLDVSWDVCEYRAGDSGDFRWYIQGIEKYKSIVLTRAVAKKDFDSVKDWLESGDWSGSGQSGSIKLLDTSNNVLIPVAEWELLNVMPLHWSVDTFDSSQSKVALETLELAHMGFLDLSKGGGTAT
jgi:phage tail-like protein